jgi:hypothetical protein
MDNKKKSLKKIKKKINRANLMILVLTIIEKIKEKMMQTVKVKAALMSKV